MAWLGDWSKRVEITVSNTNIDSDLTHFPLLLTLGTSVGTGDNDVSFIFDELTSDENRKKIAVTKDDEETEIYVEIEKWDDANEQAWLWVSKSDLTLSSSGTTTLYLYYDSSQDDNTTYVADAGSRTEVWDSSYEMVLHMKDNTTSTVLDSTDNDNDGTKKAANEPTEATGKVGQGQDFDGSDDYILLPDNFSLFDGSKDFTVEFIVNADSVPTTNDSKNAPVLMSFLAESYYQITYDDSASNPDRLSSRVRLSISDWTTPVESTRQSIDTDYFHATTFDTTNGWVWYEDGASQDTNANTETFTHQSRVNYIGWINFGTNRHFNGVLDEVRISSTVRSADWIKATYYSGDDNLVSWGSEEEAEAEETIGPFPTFFRQ